MSSAQLRLARLAMIRHSQSRSITSSQIKEICVQPILATGRKVVVRPPVIVSGTNRILEKALGMQLVDYEEEWALNLKEVQIAPVESANSGVAESAGVEEATSSKAPSGSSGLFFLLNTVTWPSDMQEKYGNVSKSRLETAKAPTKVPGGNVHLQLPDSLILTVITSLAIFGGRMSAEALSNLLEEGCGMRSDRLSGIVDALTKGQWLENERSGDLVLGKRGRVFTGVSRVNHFVQGLTQPGDLEAVLDPKSLSLISHQDWEKHQQSLSKGGGKDKRKVDEASGVASSEHPAAKRRSGK